MEDEEKIPPPPQTAIPPPPQEIRVAKYANLEIGKVPPQATDLEEVVLGALMIDSKAASEIMEFMIPDVFFNMSHRLVFEAIQTLYVDQKPIDLLTVSEELRRTGNLPRMGGEITLINMTLKVSSGSHIEWHSRIIMQKFILRRMIELGNIVVADSYQNDPDIFDLMDKVESEIAVISNIALKGKKADENLTPKEESKLKREMKAKGLAVGFPIGVSDFDNWCGGFRKRWLVVIAARPGMGKTTVGLAIAANSGIDKGIPTTFYALEMPKTDLYNRLAARLTGVPFSKIDKGETTDEEAEKVDAAFDYLDNSNLTISDTKEHGNNLERIISDIRKKYKEGHRIFFIDYGQLIKLSRSSGDRTSDLGTITRELKATANELSVPIILFAQLLRSVDKNPGHRPTLADIKQSGSFEEDADMVIFVLRQDYYTKNDTDILTPPQVAGDTEWIVAKGRSTGTRDFRTYMDFSKYTFESYSDAEF